jgi:TolB protein
MDEMRPVLIDQTLLGQYRVEKFIAPTPLGDLYRAWDVHTNAPLAMTVFPPEWDQYPETIKKLEAESLTLQHLSHPNLVPYRSVHRTAPINFMLEAWIDGPSLRDVMESQPDQALAISEALTYMHALSNALDYLHSKGYVHVNVAPELIRIDQRGNIFLGGLATCQHIGEKGALLPDPFLPLHSTPEQYNGEALTASSDVYSLSALLFEFLTGRWLTDSAPLDSETIRRTHTYLAPPVPRNSNSSVPDFLSRLVTKGLSKKPADRMASANEFFLSACMSMRVPAEAVPEKITEEDAPATHALISSWNYLQQPERIEKKTGILNQPKREGVQIGYVIRAALGLLLALAIFGAVWMIRPPEARMFAPQGNATLISSPLPSLPPLITPTYQHGGRIIYTCERGDFNQICIINADGSGLVQLTNQSAQSYYPTFAPQGGTIVFASNRAGSFDLFLAILTRRELYQLTSGVGNVFSPDFSPEGQKILFANRAAEGPTAIWTINRDGTNAKLLYAGPNTIVAAAWSPDGRQIAFAMAVDQAEAYELFIMSADATNVRRVSQGISGIGGSVDWSLDGKSLLFFAGPSGKHEIYLLEIESGNLTQLTTGGNNVAPSFSPDGAWIVFNSDRNGNSEIFIMRADGSDMKQLTTDPGADWQPQWEP